MDLRSERKKFEENKKIYESVKLKFNGVDGYDVYNCSIPFTYKGERYIYGRVEKPDEWARSLSKLFKETAKDEFTLVPNSMIYQLEDPYVSFIHGQLVLGGTHVRYNAGKLDGYCGYFYKGTELEDLYYFTSGPYSMKDIRLVQLADGKIGLFSRPGYVGYTVVDSLDEITSDLIKNAPPIDGFIGEGQNGSVNQAYLLDSGLVGIIGHLAYRENDEKTGILLSVYTNISAIFDPKTKELYDYKVIGTRPCYPDFPPKKPYLADCTFTSGIVMRDDGKVDLYGGMGDRAEGRITIDYPFEGYGKIVTPDSI